MAKKKQPKEVESLLTEQQVKLANKQVEKLMKACSSKIGFPELMIHLYCQITSAILEERVMDKKSLGNILKGI